MRRPTIEGRKVRTTVSTSGSSGTVRKIHQNCAGFDADSVNGNAEFIVERTRASCGIELPRVPGAGDHSAVEYAMPERTAMMRANSRHCANLAIHIANSVETAVSNDLDQRARRQLVRSCDPDISQLVHLVQVLQQMFEALPPIRCENGF